MAIGSANNKEIQFKKRGNDNKLKVLIYGRDGSGKSTYAEQYCKENGLNAVVIDVEDTNYTDMVMVNDIDFVDRYGGYLDIGLYDTIGDMICTVVGSFMFIVIMKKRLNC